MCCMKFFFLASVFFIVHKKCLATKLAEEMGGKHSAGQLVSNAHTALV